MYLCDCYSLRQLRNFFFFQAEDGIRDLVRSRGLGDVYKRQPMRPDMLVEHGSNGKALTAWAVMKLVEQGKVDLDAPVNLYLKRWKVTSAQYDASQVTLRRLLSHTCLLYTSDAADERSSVDLGGRRIIKKNN